MPPNLSSSKRPHTTAHTVAAAVGNAASFEELVSAVARAQSLKLITIQEVCHRTGMGASFVRAESAAGRFPKAVKLGASKSRRAAARYVDGEISDWILQRIADRDGDP